MNPNNRYQIKVTITLCDTHTHVLNQESKVIDSDDDLKLLEEEFRLYVQDLASLDKLPLKTTQGD